MRGCPMREGVTTSIQKSAAIAIFMIHNFVALADFKVSFCGISTEPSPIEISTCAHKGYIWWKWAICGANGAVTEAFVLT